MSPQLIDEPGTQSTTAGGAMQSAPGPKHTFDLGDLPSSGTAAHSFPLEDRGHWRVSSTTIRCLEGTSGGGKKEQMDTRAAISELRRLAGLTWEQLAGVFGTSRRSLHFWASGQPINAPNKEHLSRLLAMLKQTDRGTAHENREMLLGDHDGVIPLDLLTRQNYNEFLQLVGVGPGRRYLELKPLSREAQEARRPPPPQELIDALQDRVHVDTGRGRAARTVRSKRRGRDG